MGSKKYRLITRSDFDGLVCAMILKELDMIDDIKFVHPKDMQENLIEVTENDITTNLPYVDGVHLAFDHHFSETLINTEKKKIFSESQKKSAIIWWVDLYTGAKLFLSGYYQRHSLTATEI